MSQTKQKVGVIAIGGGGGNILESVLQDHPEYATMVVNADKQSLQQSAAAENQKLIEVANKNTTLEESFQCVNI